MISCDELDFVCEECYQVIYDDCEDITLELGLTALTSYCVKFYDKFGNTFNQTITTDANGSFDIDQSLLPDNFFNPFTGKVEVQIFETCDAETRVSFTAAYTQFRCLLLINSEDQEADEDISISISGFVSIIDGDGNLVVNVPCGDQYVCDIGGGDATVQNSDNSYSDTVACGGTLILPDETYNVYVAGIFQSSTTSPALKNETINIVWI